MQKRQLLHVSHNHWRAIMQNDSNVEMALPESQFINNMGLKKAKDIIQNMPEGARYWVVTTGYHNDIPDFSQYKFQHLYNLELLKKHIEEYEQTHGINFGIPEYLLCEPRTYKVNLNSWHESTCELEFTVVIKCTDDELHEHNNFWSGHKYRLEENNGDVVAVILKMIGRKVFWYCYENGFSRFTGAASANEIFQQEGWLSDCFEITKLHFENLVDDDEFEFEPVVVEG